MVDQQECHVRCLIKGKVQGVGYRNWTQSTALRLGLCGWVMNQADGSVCAVFTGTAKAVREMIAACHNGPRGAVVTSLAEMPEQEQGEPLTGTGFKIRGL